MGPNVDGISVYYNNNKKKKNIVFFEGGQHAPYADGEMLAEFITEEAFYMVTDKAFYAISSFPDRAKRPTKETIANGFLWLCGLVEDDDFPVVSAIFRSSFSSAIQTVLNDTDLTESCKSTGELLKYSYDEYYTSLMDFYGTIASMAETASGTEDQTAIAEAEAFRGRIEKMMGEYSTQCQVCYGKNHRVTIETVQIESLSELLVFEGCRMKKNNKVIKVCENCDRYFIPPHRKDTIYCEAPSPQDPNRTCKQVGANNKTKKKLQEDPQARRYHTVRSKWNMAIHREKTKYNGDETILQHYARRKLEELSEVDPVIKKNVPESEDPIGPRTD